MVPTYLAPFVIVAGLFANSSQAIYWQTLFSLFGSAAIVELTALGGAPLNPAVSFLPFLVFRAIREVDFRTALSAVPRSGFRLILLALWVLLGAAFLPRLLEGTTEVLSVDRSSGDTSVTLYPLRPLSGNLTQSAYALGGVVAFFAMRSLLTRPAALGHFRNAVLMLGVLNSIAAVTNLAEFHLGLPKVLEYVRNANYFVFDAYEEGGLMRLQGTFSEASAFAVFTLPIFAFSSHLWLAGERTRLSGMVAATSLLFLLISTSGTAYVSLAIYLVCVGSLLFYRSASQRLSPQLAILVLAAAIAATVVLAAFIFETAVAARIVAVADHFVFGKLESSSGVERTAWNAQAWRNFLESYGLGVGVGSARASSYLLVLLSNTGVVGTALFIAFLTSLFRTPQGTTCPVVASAARHATFACLLCALLAVAVFDLGIGFYAYAAAASVRENDLSRERDPRNMT